MGALKFEDSRGRTVTVKNIENNIAILNNGERVSVERLKDRNYFTPLNEGVVSTSNQHVQHTPINENNNNNNNMDITSDEARYRAIAENKSYSIGDDGGDTPVMRNTQRTRHNQSSDVRMSGSVVESHNDNLRAIGKDPIEEEVAPVSQPYQPSNMSKEEELLLKYGQEPAPTAKSDPRLEEIAYGKKISRDEIKQKRQERIDNIDYSDHVDEEFLPPSQQNQQPVKPEVNPVHQMFDKAKKVHPLNVTLKLNEKIPSKDVIKMMEESFDESAVDYYAKDIFKKLMEDPSVIENQVKDAIKKYLKSRAKK
tara:strand:- start:3328 stop:4257 length:930 start_codon:yes stop_codon:yes gene_type:complete